MRNTTQPIAFTCHACPKTCWTRDAKCSTSSPHSVVALPDASASCTRVVSSSERARTPSPQIVKTKRMRTTRITSNTLYNFWLSLKRKKWPHSNREQEDKVRTLIIRCVCYFCVIYPFSIQQQHRPNTTAPTTSNSKGNTSIIPDYSIFVLALLILFFSLSYKKVEKENVFNKVFKK